MTRIIYANDNYMDLLAFRGQLGVILPGEEPHLVMNGRQLVDCVSLPNGYDLVLTDNNMPELWGIDAIREIRTFAPDIPVYLTSTNKVLSEDWQAAGATGFLDRSQGNYLTKLTEVIQRHLC